MPPTQSLWLSAVVALLFAVCPTPSVYGRSSDITSNVFSGGITEGIVAAFGDFNSDELTDVFVLQNDHHMLAILLGNDVDPLLRPGPFCNFTHNVHITSVVPGDFDGDAYMDVLMTVRTTDPNILAVYVNWGDSDKLNCTREGSEPLFRMRGEPVALDYNKDMIIDLFGLDTDGRRTFWVFSQTRQAPRAVPMTVPPSLTASNLSVPHSHAYLDLNNDFEADLFLSTDNKFEVWYGQRTDADAIEPFVYSHQIDLPTGLSRHVGQSLFVDIELSGQLNQVLPFCFDEHCRNSTLLVHVGGQFHDLQVNFKDGRDSWGFVPPQPQHDYLNAITLRGGDFNMDGYTDLLVTLVQQSTATAGSSGWFPWSKNNDVSAQQQPQTFLLENVACQRNCGQLQRTFEVKWHALAPFANGTVAGAFYDFYQDGILDVLFVEQTVPQASRLVAFRNLLDYDANFVKCIVLTGLTNRREPMRVTPLGRKKRTYGTNLPGPRIEYTTTTQEGDVQRGTAAQIPQSGYFSLQLPYTIFGLGRTPNFVDKLTVGLANESRTWFQLIPNSQMIVVPFPLEQPSGWKAQLFVTPGKLIVKSVIALSLTCVLIMLIILGLYIKEKREDKVEKLQEAHRFPFDAM